MKRRKTVVRKKSVGRITSPRTISHPASSSNRKREDYKSVEDFAKSLGFKVSGGVWNEYGIESMTIYDGIYRYILSMDKSSGNVTMSYGDSKGKQDRIGSAKSYNEALSKLKKYVKGKPKWHRVDYDMSHADYMKIQTAMHEQYGKRVSEFDLPDVLYSHVRDYLRRQGYDGEAVHILHLTYEGSEYYDIDGQLYKLG